MASALNPSSEISDRASGQRSAARLRAAVACATLAVAGIALGTDSASAATVLAVPVDYPTIQAAIDAAIPGDTVSVSPGVYDEVIDNHSKAITIESIGGPTVTTIDGGQVGTVVRLIANPGETPVLRGFTIQNGYAFPDAGGIMTYGGPALVEDNHVSGNYGCNGAVEASFSAATVQDNVISDNHINCSGGFGGGVFIGGAGTATITHNLISGNPGGISVFAAGSPTISGNTVTANTGDGISLGNQSNALIENNLIAKNSGNGVSWLVPLGETGPTVVNNTIVGNAGSAIFADGFDISTRVFNNVLAATGSQAVLSCGSFNDLNPPIITFNDVFNAGSGPDYGGICTDQTGINGNISADPLFVDAGSADYHLQQGSPAIDAGTNAGAATVDLDGNPRPIDGNSNGVAIVDMGAYEVSPSDTTPPVIVVPAPITTNATSPAGATVSYSVTASDPDDAVASLVCSPASGSVFPIGTTTVNCTASDTHSNTSRTSFNVHVEGATEQLSDLASAVTGIGPGASLVTKANQALAYVNRGEIRDACATLTAFINQVKAQTGKTIAAPQAATLIANTDQIKTLLGC